jgi:hypothetical protein
MPFAGFAFAADIARLNHLARCNGRTRSAELGTLLLRWEVTRVKGESGSVAVHVPSRRPYNAS